MVHGSVEGVKTINHFDQNRPVHLARRDIYFERAAEMIFAQQNSNSLETGIEDYEEMLFLLRVSRQHARFAIRNAGKNEADEQFCKFINLLAGNVKAVLSMINLKGMVDSSEGLFFSFLGSNQASIALQAEEYQRRASDIVRSIHNTLMLAEEPFEQLKVENFSMASEDEQDRYTTAREHFAKLVREGHHRYKIIPSARKKVDF